MNSFAAAIGAATRSGETLAAVENEATLFAPSRRDQEPFAPMFCAPVYGRQMSGNVAFRHANNFRNFVCRELRFEQGHSNRLPNRLTALPRPIALPLRHPNQIPSAASATSAPKQP